MSAHYPPARMSPARVLARKPSLRWRLRHWLKVRLFGNPPQPWAPTTEWGRMRRAERIELVAEVLQAEAERFPAKLRGEPKKAAITQVVDEGRVAAVAEARMMSTESAGPADEEAAAP